MHKNLEKEWFRLTFKNKEGAFKMFLFMKNHNHPLEILKQDTMIETQASNLNE